MALEIPSISDFKDQFAREFYYGERLNEVRDTDIQRAIRDVYPLFNFDLWGDQTETTTAYLFASAHFLVENLKSIPGNDKPTIAFGPGMRQQGNGIIVSSSVGGVSATYEFPEFIKKSPFLFQFLNTDFGCRYLAMLTPRLVGALFVLPNATAVYDGGPTSTQI